MKDFGTWEWRRLGKVTVTVEHTQREKIERYLKWLALLDKGAFVFKAYQRQFHWENVKQAMKRPPLIIGDQRDPERSDPRRGRRWDDATSQVGLSAIYVLAIPGSSLALQQPFVRLAEVTNATHDWRASLLSVAFMLLTSSVLWLALSAQALHHTRRAVALIKSRQLHRR